MVAHIQNISQEPQLVRIKGVKTVVKPGEIAECEESEKSIAKTYKSIFKVVDSTTIGKAPVASDALDYSKMKQPELRSLCVDRGIGLKAGVLKNADIIALLIAFDEAKKVEAPKVPETPVVEAPVVSDSVPSTDGSEGTQVGAESNASAPEVTITPAPENEISSIAE
jgi:hypothetical protein